MCENDGEMGRKPFSPREENTTFNPEKKHN